MGESASHPFPTAASQETADEEDGRTHLGFVLGALLHHWRLTRPGTDR